jgi:hypothetical protein
MDLLERRLVLATIAAKIEPYVGRTMAEASARLHCEKLGIDGETVDATQIDQLLLRIRTGLVIFIGPENSLAVTNDIRETLSGRGSES